MKKHLKSIIQIWNEFEFSPCSGGQAVEPAAEIIAYKDKPSCRILIFDVVRIGYIHEAAAIYCGIAAASLLT